MGCKQRADVTEWSVETSSYQEQAREREGGIWRGWREARTGKDGLR